MNKSLLFLCFAAILGLASHLNDSIRTSPPDPDLVPVYAAADNDISTTEALRQAANELSRLLRLSGPVNGYRAIDFAEGYWKTSDGYLRAPPVSDCILCVWQAQILPHGLPLQ